MVNMSRATPIKPDVIVNTIRELQQEKSRQEKTLVDLRKSRTQLERRNEAAMRDLHLAKQKHDKLVETLKIAQHKLEESQKELDCQQSRNKDLESKIEMLAMEIDQEKDRQQREVEDFQSKLSELADKFIQARKYYMDDNLANEIAIVKKRKNGLEPKAIAVENEAEKLADQLSNLNLQKEAQIKNAEHDGISLELQHQILKMFLTEKSVVEAFQKDLTVKEKDLQEQVEKQQATNEDLKTKLVQLEEEMKSETTEKGEN